MTYSNHTDRDQCITTNSNILTHNSKLLLFHRRINRPHLSTRLHDLRPGRNTASKWHLSNKWMIAEKFTSTGISLYTIVIVSGY